MVRNATDRTKYAFALTSQASQIRIEAVCKVRGDERTSVLRAEHNVVIHEEIGLGRELPIAPLGLGSCGRLFIEGLSPLATVESPHSGLPFPYVLLATIKPETPFDGPAQHN